MPMLTIHTHEVYVHICIKTSPCRADDSVTETSWNGAHLSFYFDEGLGPLQWEWEALAQAEPLGDLNPLLASWTWASYLTLWSFSFHIWTLERGMVPAQKVLMRTEWPTQVRQQHVMPCPEEVFSTCYRFVIVTSQKQLMLPLGATGFNGDGIS